MFLNVSDPVWFYRHPIDFRKQMDGLIMLVSSKLQKDPICGQWFIFRNRGGNKLKCLLWDKNGFWLCYKRLEKGHFKLPEIEDSTQSLSREEFYVLLAGLDFRQKGYFQKVTATYFH